MDTVDDARRWRRRDRASTAGLLSVILFPLGALTIRWTGGDSEILVGDEFDEPNQVEEQGS